jgi:uncharacterized protein with FMN-binding domain
MSNNLRTNQGGFSRVPKRGAVALVTTILAVVLLFSFRTSDPTTAANGLPNNGFVGAPAGATPGPVAAAPRPTSHPAAGATPAPRQSLAPGVTPAPATPEPQQPAATPAPITGTETVDGDPIDTFYGTVQIALVVQNGKIVDVQELQMPSDRRLSQQISAQAGPMLRSQALRSQSADINGVSGASYTSYGFWKSLQSALAKM